MLFSVFFYLYKDIYSKNIMKKNKKHIINIENTVGIRKSTDIIANSFEEAMAYINTITAENVHIVLFDENHRILFSKHKGNNGRNYEQKVNHVHHVNFEDDLYA